MTLGIHAKETDNVGTLDMVFLSFVFKKLHFVFCFLLIWYVVFKIYDHIKSFKTSIQVPECKKCSKTIVPYIKNVENACGPNINLVVLVLNHVDNYLPRSMIRETWGNQKDQLKFNTKVIFFVGKTDYMIRVNQEHKDFNDIVQIDLHEDYRKLSIKTTLAFGWMKTYCPNVKYILKTDDDVFINLKKLIDTTRRYNLNNVIGGHCFGYEFPDRNNRSKWYVSYEEYVGKKYPPYCSGGGYLMQTQTAIKLYEKAKDTPFFPMEDVFVGFLAHKAGIRTLSLPGFYIFSKPSDVDFYCRCLVVRHRVNIKEGYAIWSNITCHRDWDNTETYPCVEETGEIIMTSLTFAVVLCLLMALLLCGRVR